jgi:hypothetical protein
LQAAQLDYTAERREAVLASRLAVQSSGFFAAFKSVRTEVEAQSHLDDGGELRSARYRFAQVKSDESKYVDIDYAADGSIRDLRIERDGKIRKTKVPEEHWTGTVDPLTAIAAIRRDLGKGLLSSNHPMRTYRVFDGRKRYDIHMTWLARIDDDQNPLETSAHKIVANRTPVAGYDTDDEDWQRHLRGEQRPLQLLTTADQQAIPYLAMSTQSLVEREIKLEQLCIDKKCYPS